MYIHLVLFVLLSQFARQKTACMKRREHLIGALRICTHYTAVYHYEVMPYESCKQVLLVFD
jgi:hypothetical protein